MFSSLSFLGLLLLLSHHTAPAVSSLFFFLDDRHFFFLCPLYLSEILCQHKQGLLSLFFFLKGRGESRINYMILDSTISIFSAKCNTGFPYSRGCGASCRKPAKYSPSQLPGTGLPGACVLFPSRASLSHLRIVEPQVPLLVRNMGISASTCQMHCRRCVPRLLSGGN